MIKTPDRKSSPRESACYEESVESALGIAFEKRDGWQRFAPYAFLSAVDYNGKDELIFHFSIGDIIARGERLEPLWRAACKGDLARVCECAQPSARETAWVRELAFNDAGQDAAHHIPPFPGAA